MNGMCEMLENRRLMSADPAFVADGGGGVETTALLLPAVQKVREAASSSAPSGGGPGGGPVVVVFSGRDASADARSGHVTGINVCLGDGSVR